MNETNLQDYINTLSTTSYVGVDQRVVDSGALGFGPYGALAGTLLVFWAVMYIIGVIYKYKEHKMWLIPNKRYWLNLFRGVSISINSLAGIATPAAQIERSDAYYYNPTEDEFDEALLVVHQIMVNGGWTIADYQKRSKDCEDYAMKMAVEVRNYIATTFTDKVGAKGVAVGNIGYRRDVDGVGHVIVVVYLDNGVKYFEPYPGTKYLKEKPMSQTELDSINMSIM